jgi:hypothetical protein
MMSVNFSKNFSKKISKVSRGLFAFGILAGSGVLLSACSDLPNYKAKALRDAINGEGLTLQLQDEATQRMKGLPIIVNAPTLSFNIVTVDKDFSPQFNFVEAHTGYIWNNYFTQRSLVDQFISNTLLAMNAMEIPLTKQTQHYELDATILRLSFTQQLLQQSDLDKGFKQFILGRMETAYRIVDTSTRQTVFEQDYHITDTRYLPMPGQSEEVSAGLLYQMMTDSSIKFGQDIAKHCAFYNIPKIECD